MKNKAKAGTCQADLNALAAVIFHAASLKPDVVPAGFYTVEQIAKELKYSRRQTQKKISDAKKAGKVERQMFRLISAKGYAQQVAHYRIKPE